MGGHGDHLLQAAREGAAGAKRPGWKQLTPADLAADLAANAGKQDAVCATCMTQGLCNHRAEAAEHQRIIAGAAAAARQGLEGSACGRNSSTSAALKRGFAAIIVRL